MSISVESEFVIDNYRLVQEVIGGPKTYTRESDVDMGDASGKMDKTERTTYEDVRMAVFRLSLPTALQASDRVITSIRFDIRPMASDSMILMPTSQHVENMTPEAAWTQLKDDYFNWNYLYVTGSINDTVTDPILTELVAAYGCFFNTVHGDVTADKWQGIGYIAKGQAHFYVTGYSSKTPAHVDITSPGNMATQIGDEDITLTWSYNHELNTVTQYSYRVDYSTDGGITWTELAHTVSSAHTYTIPAETLPGGLVKLRLTAYTWDSDEQEEIATNSSVETITVRYNPTTSDVTCDGKPVPTVEWTGADQTAYQVRFADWDSGAIYGSDTSLTVPRVYPDDVYPVTVRTQTSGGDWSAWSETLWVEISNTDPALTVSLTAVREAATVLTAWPAVTGAAWYVLERDGIPVYAGTGLSFRDDLAVGAPAYRLLAVTSGGYYTATDPVTVALALRCDMLKALDDDTADWIRVRWSLAARSRSYDRSIDTTFRHYAGRPKPVAISSGASTRTMRTTAAYKTRGEAEALLALAGRPVVYKDANGGRIIGIINPVGYDSEHVFSLDISVTEIDWPEEAEYTYVPAE